MKQHDEVDVKELIDAALRDFFGQLKLEIVQVDYEGDPVLRAKYFLVLSSPFGVKKAQIGYRYHGALPALVHDGIVDLIVASEKEI